MFTFGQLWYLRLASLARLRLYNQTSVECTNLFVVLNGIEPPEAREYVFNRILPFELEVMQTRLKYWSGDHMGYLDALNALLNKCRTKARSAASGDVTTIPMWKERGARICLIIASQMVEMKVDFTRCFCYQVAEAAMLLYRSIPQRQSSLNHSVDKEIQSLQRPFGHLSLEYIFKAGTFRWPLSILQS